MHKNLSGTNVGPYALQELLGNSGLGQVYRARPLGRNQPDVALKLFEFPDPEFYEIGRDLIKRTTTFEHPTLVSFCDYDSENGRYLVMPFLSGGSLRKRVEYGPLQPLEVSAILHQIEVALEFLHSHRINPDRLDYNNVMFDSRGHMLLTDYMMSELIDPAVRLSIPLSYVFGDPTFIAPERWNDPLWAKRAEQYQLACLIYFMLAARTPFRYEGRIAELIFQTIQEPAPSIRKFRPDLPCAVDEVLGQALEKEPRARFASTRQFLSAIDLALQEAAAKVNQDSSSGMSAMV